MASVTKDQIPSDVLRQVADELGHYVYALVDPNDGIPFYIGKGTGDRFAAHGREALWTYDGGDLETEVDEQALSDKVRKIREHDGDIDIWIIRHGLSKAEYTQVEAACIDLLTSFPAVSMGGSNEFVECFCGGAVVEGGSGAVVELVGDGVEVGLVAGDGGSFGEVSADEPVGVFVSSSLPGAVGVSEEHVHAGVVGEALVSGHFPALVPGQCAHRLVGKALDAAGERVTDLVGSASQGQGHDDQVAGGALNQGRARAGPVLADDQVAFPVTRDFPIRNVGALINQPHPNDGGFLGSSGGCNGSW